LANYQPIISPDDRRGQRYCCYVGCRIFWCRNHKCL